MFSWLWPWIFLLLPAPLILRWLAPAQSAQSKALRAPFFHPLQRLTSDTKAVFTRRWWRLLILTLLWLSLVCAAARPTWIGEPIPLPREGRDLLLAVDISQSMAEEDMQVGSQYASRIAAVKAVVSDFIERRTGDRLGLILFGEQGYLQTPLTFDRNTVQIQLQEAQLGFAGNATAIGDAIGLAVKRLRNRDAEGRILILLTDGANTAGTDPRQAANVAAEANIRIHTIGIGSDARRTSNLYGITRTINPSSALDEQTLSYIADSTGGQYFRARNPDELARIYAELDRLEPVPEDVTFRPQRSLFQWPLGLALLISFVLALTGANTVSKSSRRVS
jgi:Ca-activated chloride channel family protein